MLHKDETELRARLFPHEVALEKAERRHNETKDELTQAYVRIGQLQGVKWKYRWLRNTGVTIMVPGHGAVYLQGDAMDEWMSENVPGEGFSESAEKQA